MTRKIEECIHCGHEPQAHDLRTKRCLFSPGTKYLNLWFSLTTYRDTDGCLYLDTALKPDPEAERTAFEWGT